MADKDNRLKGARGLGAIGSKSYKDSLGKSDLDDLVRFSVSKRSSFQFNLSGIPKGGDYNATLYAFKRPVRETLNRIGGTDIRKLGSNLNTYFRVIQAAKRTGNQPESIQVKDLAIGEYLVRLERKKGDGSYRVKFNATPIPIANLPGNSPITAFPTSLAANSSLKGSFTAEDRNDFYTFTPAAAADYRFSFTGAGQVDVLAADGKTVLKSVTSANSTFIQPFGANQKYFIKFSKGSSPSNSYALTATKLTDAVGNSEAAATPLSLVAGQPALTRSNYVVSGGISSADLYSFTVTQPGSLTVELKQLFGNLNVELYKQGKAGQGLISQRPGSSTEGFSGKLDAGNYFLRIFPGAVGAGSSYQLQARLNTKGDAPIIARDIRFNSIETPSISNITKIGGVGDRTIYFSATDEDGVGLWKSDGTLDGTQKIKSFFKIQSQSKSFTVMNGELYFVADDGASGLELWKSDGTSSGTRRVADIRSGISGSDVSELTVLGSGATARLYFLANPTGTPIDQRLYRTDGTAVTDLLGQQTDPVTNPDDVVGTTIKSLTALGDTLYFTGKNGVSFGPGKVNSGTELWRINNSLNKALLTDLNPNSGSNPTSLTLAGGKLFLMASTSLDSQLIRIDSFDDPNTPGDELSYTAFDAIGVSNLTTDGTNLYFSASFSGKGIEVGGLANAATATSGAAFRMTDINPDSSDALPSNFVNVGGAIYFFATKGDGSRQLFKLDGSPTGATQMNTVDLDINADPSSLIGVDGIATDDVLYFVAKDPLKGTELFKVNAGTGATTVLDINQQPIDPAQPTGANASASPSQLTQVDDTLYFVADDGINGPELWSL